MVETHPDREVSSLAATSAAARQAGLEQLPRDIDFDRVYAEFFPFVWRTVQSLGVARPGLDDACQDVFLVVHRRLAEFELKSSLRTWIYGIARKVAFNHRRRYARKGRAEPLMPDLESDARNPHELAEDREAASFVQSFVASLPQSKREVFVLSVIEQWSAPEVAEALKVPLNTVYSRLRDARLEFQAAIAKRSAST
jgi:RNA polymerase sigma-70 factor, ECF subfamily